MKEKVKRTKKFDDRDLAIVEIFDDPVLYGEFCRELEDKRTEKEDDVLKAAYIESLMRPRQIKISKAGKILKPSKSAIEIVQANSQGKEIKPLTKESKISGVGGVYIICRDGEVLYIGESINLESRLKDHHWGFGSEILYIVCENAVDRMKLEANLIKTVKPQLNVTHNV